MNENTNRLDRTKVIVELVIVLFSIYWAIQNIISIKIMLVIVLYFGLLLLLLQYKWRYSTWQLKSNQEHYERLINTLSNTKRIFAYFTILMPLTSLVITFGHVKFPEWQKQFIIEHFTKPDEIHEIKAKVSITKFAEYNAKLVTDTLSKGINEANPYIFLNTENIIRRYDNQFIVGEMLFYLSNNFCSLSLSVFGLLLILTLLLILADIFGQISLSTVSNKQNNTNE